MKNLLSIACLFLCSTMFAQTYNVSAFQENYEPLEQGISVTDNVPWEGLEYAIPIGFDFLFFDITIDSLFSMEIESIILTESSDVNSDIDFSAIIPMVVDGIFNAVGDPSQSPSNISYLTTGEVGSRICKIEWNNVGLLGYSNAIEQTASLQLWLYEGTGTLELRYGENNVQDTDDLFFNPGPSIGLAHNFNGNTEEFDEFFILDGDPANPNVGFPDYSAYSYYYDFHLNGMPESGTVYSFTRATVSTNEIAKLSSQFSLQPNPSAHAISLKTQFDFSDILSVSIYNSAGALIKTVRSNYENIDISRFHSGVYNMQILTADGLAAKRFVKVD